MLYWQKELKNIDYSQEPLTLPDRKIVSMTKPSHILMEESKEGEGETNAEISELMRRLKMNEMKVRDLYLQAGLLLNDYSTITRELAVAMEDRINTKTDDLNVPIRSMDAIDISDVAVGDIVRIHHHIWQDYYYITSVEDTWIKGYKLNRKNMMIRRNSKEKVITQEMLHFIKLVQRNVRYEDVFLD